MPSKESEAFLESLRKRPTPTGVPTFQEVRANFAASMTARPLPVGISVEKNVTGGVPCELLTPPQADVSRLILFFHGGGNVVGSLDSHREVACRVAVSAKCPVLAVGFRVGPEDPFPAAVDDAVAVYRAILSSGRTASEVAVAGDSAGAGLAVALVISERDSGRPMPACGILLSPCVDLSLSSSSIRDVTIVDPTFRREGVQRMFEAYLGGADPKTPLASPLYADLRSLPPLLIQSGSLEAFLEEARAFHLSAIAAGVDSTMEEFEGQVHDFHTLAPSLPETLTALSSIGSFVASKWFTP